MPNWITAGLNNATVSAAPGAPGPVTSITVDAVDYTDPDVAHITGTATLPTTLNSFDGCELFRTIGASDPDPLGHQYHQPGAAGPFSFDLRLTRPSTNQTWRIWFVSRNAQNAGQLVTAAGPSQTPFADIAITARPPSITVETPNAPTAVAITVVDQQGSFGIQLAWTPPAPIGGTIGYEREVRYFSDSGGSTPVSDWIALGQVGDGDLAITIDGYWPRPEATQYVRGRIRAVNANNEFSAWVQSAALDAVDPLAVPPSIGGVALTVQTADQGGVPSFRLSFTITPAGSLGTTDGYIAEARYYSDAGGTTPISNWILLGWVDPAELTYNTDYFPRPDNTQYVRVRVAGQNVDNGLGAWTESTVQAVTGTTGLKAFKIDLGTLGPGLGVLFNQLRIPDSAVTASMIQNINANQINGLIAANQIQTINANQISGLIVANQIQSVNGNTILIGTIQDGSIVSVGAGKITAGTITATISIISPIITVNGGGFTVNIDTSNGIKVTSSANQSVAQLSAGYLSVAGTGSFSAYSGLYSATLSLLAYNGGSGAPSISSSVSSTQATLNVRSNGIFGFAGTGWGIGAGSFGNIISCNASPSSIELTGGGSYITVNGEYRVNSVTVIDSGRNYRHPTYFVETIFLGGVTSFRWLPAYDSGGAFLGKIPLV